MNRKNWEEFRETGLLWFINSILHIFGWAIVVEYKEQKIITAFPARVVFRGFDEKSNTDGYMRISEYMKNNAEVLCDEANDEIGG